MTLSYRKCVIQLLLLITLLITTFLHLWRLTEFPPPLTGDEAKNGIEVLLLMAEPRLTAFIPSNAGREAMFHYLLMLPIALFGPTVFALRIIPALAGVLMIALTYRWVRFLLSTSKQAIWIALVAAIFTATSLWPLQLSRLGLRGILLVPCMLASYYFFWRGYRCQMVRWFVFSGISLGLAIHTYPASRALPLVFILFVVCLSIFYRKQQSDRLKISWQGLIIAGLVSIIVFAPLGWYFLNHPETFLFRSNMVSLQSSYEMVRAPDQSYLNFLLLAWGKNLRWFIDLSTPWLQNRQFPLVVHLLPLFLGIGLFRAGYLAWRHVGYLFLLLSFLVGILPILIGEPTSMRVILAIAPTYALLAIGIMWPLGYLTKKIGRFDFPIKAVVTTSLLLISTISIIGTFNVRQWIGPPPLTATFDYGLGVTADRVKDLVLNKKRSILIPQIFYNSPVCYYLLQEGFAEPLPVENRAMLAPSKTISIFWPVEAELILKNKPLSFVLLSPDATGQQYYIETIGQWEQAQFEDFKNTIEAKITATEAEIIVDTMGNPIGHIIELERQQVLNALRSEPQNPIQFEFQEGIELLGYDTWFLSERELAIGLFWRTKQKVMDDYLIQSQLLDQHRQVLGEVTAPFYVKPAYWYPEQLYIEHQIIHLSDSLQPDTYVVSLTFKDKYDNPESNSTLPLGLLPIDVSAPKNNLDINFADKIRLTGYQLTPGATPNKFQISLNWQALQSMDKDYTVTIQLLDQNQNLIAQVDKPPLGGSYPTSVWQPGSSIFDSYNLELPGSVANGAYQLVVRLYDLQTLQRLPVIPTADSASETDLAILQQIDINR